MEPIPFASFRDKFAGQTAVVVGKGPTLYDFGQLGSTGAPTFFVGGEMFWGNDRLDWVEQALRRAAGRVSA